MSNEIQKTNGNKMGFTTFMTAPSVQKKIDEIIGGEKGQRFISSIISAVNNNTSLKECDNASILSGALLGESLNLSPSPQLGNYYLVPFNDKERGKVATFQLGYKGYIQLAIRSGQYKDIDVIEIKEGEYLGRDKSTGKAIFEFIENDEERLDKPTIGYLAYFELLNGFRKELYWSKVQMEKHANTYSQGYRAKKGYTFWEKDFDAMAFKTMLRQLISKWGIMSIDMQNAFEGDMAYIKEDGSKKYIDNGEFIPNVSSAEIVEDEPKKTTKKVSLDEVQ